MITQEQIKDSLSYNPDTGNFIWVNISKYHSEKIGRIAGTINASRGKEYIAIRISGKSYGAHRLAWIFTHGWQPEEIDHINGNSLDNRIINLRSCDRLTNNQNHTKGQNKSGLPLGVRVLSNGRYQARIRANHKTRYLGAFATPKEAGEAYSKAREKLHDAPAANGANK